MKVQCGSKRYSSNLDTRWVWVVNVTPRPLYPRERPVTHCIGGWVGPRAGLDGYGKSGIAVTVWQIPDAVDTVVCAPDDGWWYHPEHVEQFPDKMNCVMSHLVGCTLEYYYDARTHERWSLGRNYVKDSESVRIMLVHILTCLRALPVVLFQCSVI